MYIYQTLLFLVILGVVVNIISIATSRNGSNTLFLLIKDLALLILLTILYFNSRIPVEVKTSDLSYRINNTEPFSITF
jgi:hypothetical protein